MAAAWGPCPSTPNRCCVAEGLSPSHRPHFHWHWLLKSGDGGPFEGDLLKQVEGFNVKEVKGQASFFTGPPELTWLVKTSAGLGVLCWYRAGSCNQLLSLNCSVDCCDVQSVFSTWAVD